MIEDWTDKDYAEAAIDMLPGDAEGIREFLKREGIKGGQHSGNYCPIAQWIKRWVDWDKDVFVTTIAVELWTDSIWLPIPVWEFIRAYDYGKLSL